MTPPSRTDAEQVLRRYWGHTGLRDAQWEVISAVLEGRDVLGILPTGGGKSICYQLPAVLTGGVTLVITPLISLMQDQVHRLRKHQVPAAFMHSGMSAPEIDRCWTDVEQGRVLLLYIAPERLDSEMFLARAPRLPIARIAIDEAHCASEWGRDFRPAYLRIPECYPLLGHPPVMALTATATPQVRGELGQLLGLRNPVTIVRGFDRPNITWTVHRGDSKRARLLDLASEAAGAGIVYTASRRSAQVWSEWLQGRGFANFVYHGGMTPGERQQVQDRWTAGERRFMVATSAFGMGIDRPDVRLVVHVDLPATLESYYQEAGRAGRDGLPARAVLLADATDEVRTRQAVRQAHPDEKQVRAIYDAIADGARIPMGGRATEPVRVNVSRLAEQMKLTGPGVRAALEAMERQGIIHSVPLRPNAVRLRMTVSPERARAYAESVRSQALRRFVDALLRTIEPEAHARWWDLDLYTATRRTGLEEDRLYRGLEYLAQRGLLKWYRAAGERLITFTQPRVRAVQVDAARYALRRAETGLKDMIRYARSVSCRRRFLLHYLGEAAPARCGNCDVCLGLNAGIVITPEDEPRMREILDLVGRGLPRPSWPAPFDSDLARTDALLDWLVQEAFLEPADPLEGSFSLTEKAVRFREQWRPRGDDG